MARGRAADSHDCELREARTASGAGRGVERFVRVRNAMEQKARIGRVADIPEDHARVYHVGSLELAAFNVDGEIHVVENTCSRGLVLDRAMVSNGEVLCPWHGWRFDLETGRCALKPDHTTRVFSVHLEEGDVFVELDDTPGGARE
jgi:nitrite reductase [NAD(P)H] small subunit